jgi:uncharacterized protein YdaU (DUF1376 family)
MHYYQHHIGDFIKATSRLTDAQAMAYLRLLWMYYDSEKPLPNDIDVLSMQVGLPIDELHILLKAYFRLENNVWKQTRCDAEIAEYRSFIGNKSKAGKASAEQRKNKRTTHDEHVLNECSTDVQLTNNHNPITNNQINITPKPPKGATSLDDYLEQCRREGKKPIEEDNSVFDYAKEIGLPHDFLRLQWLEFKNYYSLPGAKKYKAWPTVFGKSVRGNWFKLWYVKDDTYYLSTQGLQAQKLHKEAA